MSDRVEWPRIALAVPTERMVYAEAHQAFMQIAQQPGLAAMFLHGYTRTDRTRNDFALKLLESDCDYVLMLDSDHIHPHDVVYKLGRHVAVDPDKLVVGGLNFRRSEPYDPCAYVWDEEHRLYPIEGWPDGALIPVDVLGSGSILISRRCFEIMPPPWFPYDYSKMERIDWTGTEFDELRQASWPGTDIGFSALCEQYGIQQYVDTSCTSPHIMHTLVDEDTWRSQLAEWDKHGLVTRKEIPLSGQIIGGDTCPDENADASSAPDGVQTPSASRYEFEVSPAAT
jgi:hypothetical protein